MIVTVKPAVNTLTIMPDCLMYSGDCDLYHRLPI